jgi:ubiquinone/menaquinone biosynthesis C-methylase UbiE
MSDNIHFRLLALSYKIRDFLRPRKLILQEAGIKAGDQVLDFGCGPGSYIIPLSKMVGLDGKIYALDVHLLAIKIVRRLAARNQLTNIITIKSDGPTGLPDDCLDVILLYDVFHHLEHPDQVLKELHRVLKPGGILSFSDHHLKEEQFLPAIIKDNLFQLFKRGQKTCAFQKIYSRNEPR